MWPHNSTSIGFIGFIGVGPASRSHSVQVQLLGDEVMCVPGEVGADGSQVTPHGVLLSDEIFSLERIGALATG